MISKKRFEFYFLTGPLLKIQKAQSQMGFQKGGEIVLFGGRVQSEKGKACHVASRTTVHARDRDCVGA